MQCVKNMRTVLTRQPLLRHGSRMLNVHTSLTGAVRHYSVDTSKHEAKTAGVNIEGDNVTICGQSYLRDKVTNVTPTILSKTGRGLLHTPNHPLKIIKDHIEAFFNDAEYRSLTGKSFTIHDNISPVVTTYQNFDSLLFPPDHISRTPSDNYYVNSTTMLRAHTSAHQADLMREGHDAFLVSGDVYRRDEIDSSHYPVFHQMEGVLLFNEDEAKALTGGTEVFKVHDSRDDERQELHTQEAAQAVGDHLKKTLEDLAQHIFGPVEMRWVEAYFPFTHPSWELEIYFNDDWLEVLGCGVVEQAIIDKAIDTPKIGWAFGLGLERLAMVLFGIPDIRLFWTEDERFLTQFCETKPLSSMKFQPYSKHPPCFKDITFWIPDNFSQNSFSDLVRSVAGDLVEQVSLVDQFVHPKKQRTSHCYRITYRSMDRNLTNEEINKLQDELRDRAPELGVELR